MPAAAATMEATAASMKPTATAAESANAATKSANAATKSANAATKSANAATEPASATAEPTMPSTEPTVSAVEPPIPTVPAIPTIPTITPSPASAVPERPAIIRPCIVIVVRVPVIIIIRIIRAANDGDGRSRRCGSDNLRGRLGRGSVIGRGHGRRHLLLAILLHGLLLQLAVALDHGLSDFLRQAHSLEINDAIGTEMVGQGRIIDIIDNHILVNAPLIHLDHFACAIGQGGNPGGAGVGSGSVLGADDRPGGTEANRCRRENRKRRPKYRGISFHFLNSSDLGRVCFVFPAETNVSPKSPSARGVPGI